MENKDTFSYTYSAKQQEEVNNIRRKYLPKEEDRMEQLRKLDKSAAQKGTMAAIIVGVISLLMLGLGMSCTLVWADILFVPGIVIGILGMLGISSAYPLYHAITRKQREKIAPLIIQLTNELLGQK